MISVGCRGFGLVVAGLDSIGVMAVLVPGLGVERALVFGSDGALRVGFGFLVLGEGALWVWGVLGTRL